MAETENAFEVDRRGQVWADDGNKSVLVKGSGVKAKKAPTYWFFSSLNKEEANAASPGAALREHEDNVVENGARDLNPAPKKTGKTKIAFGIIFLVAIALGTNAGLARSNAETGNKDGTNSNAVTLEDCLAMERERYGPSDPVDAPSGEPTAQAGGSDDMEPLILYRTEGEGPNTNTSEAGDATTTYAPSGEPTTSNEPQEEISTASSKAEKEVANPDGSVRRDLRRSSAARTNGRLADISSKRRLQDLACEEILAANAPQRLDISSKVSKSSKTTTLTAKSSKTVSSSKTGKSSNGSSRVPEDSSLSMPYDSFLSIPYASSPSGSKSEKANEEIQEEYTSMPDASTSSRSKSDDADEEIEDASDR